MLALTPDMKTQVPLIDEQHQELINRINAVSTLGLSALKKEETERTLNFLGDYIRKHFADEEALQAKSNYPKMAQHKELHRFYENEFRAMMAEYNQNGPSALFSMKLNQSIVGWIVRHIQTEDVALGKYINAHRPA